jgi:hypothetical protein
MTDKSIVQRLREGWDSRTVGGKLPHEAADRIEHLEAELERERMRLVACGVVALANTPESATRAREMHPDYRSASLDDVIRAVDEEMRLRAELAAVRELMNCYNLGGWTDALAPMQRALKAEAELARAEVDARRYRWLRDRPRGPLNGSEFMVGACIDVWDEDGAGEQLSGDEADTVIDRARSADTPAKGDL